MAPSIQVDPQLLDDLKNYFLHEEQDLQKLNSTITAKTNVGGSFGLVLQAFKPMYGDARDATLKVVSNLVAICQRRQQQLSQYQNDANSTEQGILRVVQQLQQQLEQMRQRQSAGGGSGTGSSAGGGGAGGGGVGGGAGGGAAGGGSGAGGSSSGGSGSGGLGGGGGAAGGGSAAPQPTPVTPVGQTPAGQAPTGQVPDGAATAPADSGTSTPVSNVNTNTNTNTNTVNVGSPAPVPPTDASAVPTAPSVPGAVPTVPGATPPTPESIGIDINGDGISDLRVSVDAQGQGLVFTPVTGDAVDAAAQPSGAASLQAEYDHQFWQHLASTDELGRSADQLQQLWENRDVVAAPVLDRIGYGDSTITPLESVLAGGKEIA